MHALCHGKLLVSGSGLTFMPKLFQKPLLFHKHLLSSDPPSQPLYKCINKIVHIPINTPNTFSMYTRTFTYHAHQHYKKQMTPNLTELWTSVCVYVYVNCKYIHTQTYLCICIKKLYTHTVGPPYFFATKAPYQARMVITSRKIIITRRSYNHLHM